jgi:hypothetical protein
MFTFAVAIGDNNEFQILAGAFEVKSNVRLERLLRSACKYLI